MQHWQVWEPLSTTVMCMSRIHLSARDAFGLGKTRQFLGLMLDCVDKTDQVGYSGFVYKRYFWDRIISSITPTTDVAVSIIAS